MSSRPGRTTIAYFLSQVGVTVVGFLATWYINWRLGAAAFGEYSTAVALLFWLSIPASAIGNSVNKRISEGRQQGEFLAAGHLLNLAVHAVLVAGILVFHEQVNVFVGVDVAGLFAVLLAGKGVFVVSLSSLRGHKQVGTSGVVKFVERFVRSAIHIGALFFLGVGVAGLVVGHAVALLLAATVAIALLDGRPTRPETRHVRELSVYAQFAWLGTLKTRAFAWADVMVMRGLSLSVVGLATVSQQQIGIYRVAWTVASVLGLASIAIRHTLFPELSELSVRDDYERVHHLLTEGLAFTGLFAIPGLLGALVVGDTLLTIFGAEYAAGGTILVVLIGARLAAAYGEQCVNAINAIDRPDVAFRVNLVYVATNVGLNLLLVTLYGWYGAAVATALAALANVGVAGYALTTLVGPPDVPYREIGRQAAAAAVMALVVVAVDYVVPGTIPWTIGTIGVGAVVYTFVLVAISPRVRRTATRLLST